MGGEGWEGGREMEEGESMEERGRGRGREGGGGGGGGAKRTGDGRDDGESSEL